MVFHFNVCYCATDWKFSQIGEEMGIGEERNKSYLRGRTAPATSTSSGYTTPAPAHLHDAADGGFNVRVVLEREYRAEDCTVVGAVEADVERDGCRAAPLKSSSARPTPAVVRPRRRGGYCGRPSGARGSCPRRTGASAPTRKWSSSSSCSEVAFRICRFPLASARCRLPPRALLLPTGLCRCHRLPATSTPATTGMATAQAGPRHPPSEPRPALDLDLAGADGGGGEQEERRRGGATESGGEGEGEGRRRGRPRVGERGRWRGA